MTTRHTNGIIFHSIMNDISRKEARLQGSLWGRMYKDYVIESKSNDRQRFFISKKLYGNVPEIGA